MICRRYRRCKQNIYIGLHTAGTAASLTFVLIATDLDPKALPPGLARLELFDKLNGHVKGSTGIIGLFKIHSDTITTGRSLIAMSRVKLLLLQALVAVASVALWYALTTYPVFGKIMLPPFLLQSGRYDKTNRRLVYLGRDLETYLGNFDRSILAL